MIGAIKTLARRLGVATILKRMRRPVAVPEEVDLSQYDLIPKGEYVFGPADRFLLVPKNRYRAVLLPDQDVNAEKGVGWLTEENTPDGYDKLWGDEKVLEDFLNEGHGIRETMPAEIIDAAGKAASTANSVIDVGCGAGDLLIEVQRRNATAELFGCDFSPAAIKRASQNLPDAKLDCFTIDKTLPYEDNSFDLVLCTDVLEHLVYAHDVARELVRICAPGGTVLIVVPDGDGDQFMGHVWFFNADRLTTMLSVWAPIVRRLDVCREFAALIEKKHP